MMGNDTSAQDRIKAGYELLIFKEVSNKKLNILSNLYEDALKDYRANKGEAEKLTQTKDGSPEFAAMTVVANALLNLDEVLTKE